MAKSKRSDRYLREILGPKAFDKSKPVATSKAQRVKAGKAIEGLHGKDLHNPRVGSGDGGPADAAHQAMMKARADWRAARDSSHDDS